MSSHLNYISDRTICPSICIPRVFKHITVPFIIDIFQEKLKLGIIKKVDVIPNNNDKLFKKVFIHFASWHDNDHINTIKNKFIRPLSSGNSQQGSILNEDEKKCIFYGIEVKA